MKDINGTQYFDEFEGDNAPRVGETAITTSRRLWELIPEEPDVKLDAYEIARITKRVRRQSPLSTRGTLMRRAIIDPERLNANGDTKLHYTKDNGDPTDREDRRDAVVIAVDHRKLAHYNTTSS